ncbi:DUF2726 domain-containing protein (plasmid) [Klebsiella pneumoniae]
MNPFKGRHFQRDIILWAVRWYCKYGISYRELQEMLAERGVNVDHSTIYRWVQRYAPEMEKRLRWYWRFMKGLFRIVDMKRWYLCPQVRVADIVQLNGNIRPRSRQWWQLFRMVSQWHVDVVIVERRSFSIVAAVELDDASHLRPERRRRDILLEEVLRQAGIPLLRSHDARKLLQMTGEWLNTTGADQQSPEHRS